jgi:iron complex outermembrane receptor protein
VFWASLSRALRTPSRADHDIRAIVNAIPAGSLYEDSPVGLVELRGSREFDSETVRALDIGYRSRLGSHLLFDLAGFRYSYGRLRTNEVGTPRQPDESQPYLLLPIVIGNDASGHTAGIEGSLDWRPAPNARLQLGYSYLHMNLNVTRNSLSGFTVDSDKDSPTQQIVVRWSTDLYRGTQIDLVARYVSEIPLQKISDYVALDARLALRISESTELSVVSRNLLAGSHPEYFSSASGTLPAKVQTSLYAALRLRL